MNTGKIYRQLLFYEVKKCLRTPWLPVFVVFLLLLNGWKLDQSSRNAMSIREESEELYEDFYSQWKGTITEENVRELMKIYAPLKKNAERMALSSQGGSGTYTSTERQDYMFFASQFAEEMEYDYLYSNQAVRTANNAYSLVMLFRETGNSYEVRKNTLIYRQFAERSIPGFSDTKYLEVWFQHDYSSLLIVLLCVFCLSGMFVEEKESQMFMLLRTTPGGNKTTYLAKMTVCFAFILVISFIFYFEDICILQGLSGHADALSSPVYALRPMESGAFSMSMLSFIVWSYGVRLLGLMCIGSTVLLISCLCTRTLSVFAISTAILLAMSYMQAALRQWYVINLANPMELLMIRRAASVCEYVNFLGYPMLKTTGVIIGGVMYLLLMQLLVYRTNPGHLLKR